MTCTTVTFVRARKRKPVLVALSHVRLDDTSDRTLRASLDACLRAAILDGGIKAGTRLPSTRALATELGISRTTIADVFAQLVADGLLVARHGSGTFVAASDDVVAPAPPPTAWERASQRGRLFARRTPDDDLQGRLSLPFQPGVPSYEDFPFDTYGRIAARILRRPKPELLGYGESAGYAPLREAIAADLRARGERCRDEQIVVVGGTSQALDLIARLTLDQGDAVWLEDPSSLYVRGTFVSAGARVVPIPVDAHGIDVAAGTACAPEARLAFVTSAHQWPTGVTLGPERRTALLAWARAADAWIVEDEYDGVFRYDGTSPPSLRALDDADRVIATGTFSLTTFPAIRLGFIVAPLVLVDAFVAAKAKTDRQASLLEQAILAEFIHDGHFGRYRAKMRDVYAGRLARLLAFFERCGSPQISPPASGLHVILQLPVGTDDRALSAAAHAAGIPAPALSPHYLAAEPKSGLILGFGAGSCEQMARAAERLCREIVPLARARVRRSRS